MVEHVFPKVAVRQWVVVFPNRVRYRLNIDARWLKLVAGKRVVQALSGCGELWAANAVLWKFCSFCLAGGQSFYRF